MTGEQSNARWSWLAERAASLPKLPNLLVVALSVVLPYLILWLFVACLQAHAETTIIDAGSPTDSNFTGGTALTLSPVPAGITDATLRWSAQPFSYDFPCNVAWPYIVTFRFTEPSVTAVGKRIFTVRVNNQIVLDRIDLVAEGGLGKMLARSAVAMGADDGHIRIRFETNVRSAVISSIEFAPLFEFSVHTSGVVKLEAGRLFVVGSNTKPEWSNVAGWTVVKDISAYLLKPVPAPLVGSAPPWSNLP